MLSPRSIVILLIIATIVGSFFYLNQKNSVSIVTPSPSPTEPHDVGTIQTEDLEIKESSEVRSPDGKMKLVMEATKEGDNTVYSFVVSDTLGETNKTVFSKAVLLGTSFELSPNAWSPDNKYFFITEKGTDSFDYYVFKADGEPFSEEKQYIDIAPLFAVKNTGYVLSDVTGWASPTLIYLLTQEDNGERGPTYWLEIPSLAIIRLADR